MISHRTLTVLVIVVALALLGPYAGLHLFTTRPSSPAESRAHSAPARRTLPAAERPGANPASPRQDLSSIEDLLGTEAP